jgi:hypothetical protein
MPVDEQRMRDEVTYTCEACGHRMKLLAALPATAKHEAVRVFRCYDCNAVRSEREAA